MKQTNNKVVDCRACWSSSSTTVYRLKHFPTPRPRHIKYRSYKKIKKYYHQNPNLIEFELVEIWLVPWHWRRLLKPWPAAGPRTKWLDLDLLLSFFLGKSSTAELWCNSLTKRWTNPDVNYEFVIQKKIIFLIKRIKWGSDSLTGEEVTKNENKR